MKKSLGILFGLIVWAAANAQDAEYKEPSKASRDYHEYRLYASTPPYGLAKVKTLMKRMVDKPNGEDSDGGTEALTKKDYNSLSLREKFTYTMIHGEYYSQNCDADMAVENEEKKIFAHLASILGEQTWSERQTKFLKDNRDSVMAIIKESSQRSKRMGANYKTVILDINGKEMIPFLISFYNEKKKDGDILTLLNLLMKENKYEPFMSSATFKKLYSENAMYYSTLDYTKANEELILQRAAEFYKSFANK